MICSVSFHITSHLPVMVEGKWSVNIYCLMDKINPLVDTSDPSLVQITILLWLVSAERSDSQVLVQVTDFDERLSGSTGVVTQLQLYRPCWERCTQVYVGVRAQSWGSSLGATAILTVWAAQDLAVNYLLFSPLVQKETKVSFLLRETEQRTTNQTIQNKMHTPQNAHTTI